MKFPCPLCKSPKDVMTNRKSKPYFRCDDCGVLMFVNRPAGIRIIESAEAVMMQKPRKETAGSALFG